MTQTYHIQGMTCNGCKDSVTRAFLSLEGVHQVHVDLEKGTALLTTASVLQTKLLKEVLPSKFTLIEDNTQRVKQNNVFDRDKKAPQGSKLEQLKPLFLIFGFLLLVSSALNFREFTTLDFMLDFMGLFFFVFSLFKFLDLSGFALSFAMYDPLAKRLSLYGLGISFFRIDSWFFVVSKTPTTHSATCNGYSIKYNHHWSLRCFTSKKTNTMCLPRDGFKTAHDPSHIY